MNSFVKKGAFLIKVIDGDKCRTYWSGYKDEKKAIRDVMNKHRQRTTSTRFNFSSSNELKAEIIRNTHENADVSE